MTKRVLLFFPFCFTSRSQGNEVRVAKLLEFFARNGFTTDVLSYQGRDGLFWRRQADPLISGHLELVRFGGIVKRAARKLIALLGFPLWKFSRIDLELIVRFRRMIKEQAYSHIVVSYADWAYLLSFVKDPATLTLCDTHDIWTILERGQGRVRPGWASLGRSLAWEFSVLNRADVVITVAPFEQVFFSSFLNGRVELVPVPFDRPSLKSGISKIYDLLYVGSVNKNNVRGLRWFLREVLPAFPDLRVAIAGTICDVLAEEFTAFPNVTPLGFVEDIAGVYQQARASICPMVGGAGIKVKVIEALAHGLPVIGSSVIASGLLPGYERACYLADDAPGFITLLADLEHIVTDSEPLEYAEKYATDAVDGSLARIFGTSLGRVRDSSRATPVSTGPFQERLPVGVP